MSVASFAAPTFEGLRALAGSMDGQQLWMAVAVTGFVFSALPAMLALLTSFTRILLVLTFLRQALGISEAPPDRILTALALFLTLYTMAPVTAEIHEKALQPYLAGKLDAVSAAAQALAPLRAFMLRQTRSTDLMLFTSLAGGPRPRSSDDVSFSALVPAFVVSELKTAFQIGIAIFLPFLVIDLVVATTITSLGLAGVNPASMAIPFKLLLFVLADGWHLVVASLVKSIRV
ncbi:MAG: flagellar type III secretion system pore protein FliP [Candidatus Wallbacteria bacterium]|nr:flagellar type III secretion system pore protein FliP [Candidatus Wallbacteria bacterium]